MEQNQIQPASPKPTALAQAQPIALIQNELKARIKSFQASLKENTGTFTTSLMNIITGDEKLLQCQPAMLIAEATKAAAIKLPFDKALGQAYLLPFKLKGQMTPTFVIGYKGYIQLAMRSGKYRHINADIVYEGELEYTDKLTGEISLRGKKTSETVIGYFAHFELLNGFSKTLYMPLEDMANYVIKFSPAYRGDKHPTAQQFMERAQYQAQNGPEAGVGWWANFNAMAQKTVLRQLLSKYAPLSIEDDMARAISIDGEAPDTSARAQRDADNSEPRTTIDASKMIQVESRTVSQDETQESPSSSTPLSSVAAADSGDSTDKPDF